MQEALSGASGDPARAYDGPDSSPTNVAIERRRIKRVGVMRSRSHGHHGQPITHRFHLAHDPDEQAVQPG